MAPPPAVPGGAGALPRTPSVGNMGHLYREIPDHRPIRLGVCALDKKARSRPMMGILQRLIASGDIEVVEFGDDVILNKEVDQWPSCDCLISFFSRGFPLDKAEEYAALRRPFLINQLGLQRLLLDRRKVYKVLQEHNIPVPPHIVVNRDDGDGMVTPPPVPDPNALTASDSFEDASVASIGSAAELPLSDTNAHFDEEEDALVYNGRKLYKPFVEKPVSGEDHNVCIYYPAAVGGGMKGLFRKKADRSAEFHPEISTVRRDGSYIYEAFLPTGGTDVKVYTVGPNYAHAEARKSPVVDGRVLRDEDGKEVRYPVLLSMEEKRIAREVCMAFGQMVCGFDLLRSKGRVYVCDVNGWSFVKNSQKYYDDTAKILRSMILRALAPKRLGSAIGQLITGDSHHAAFAGDHTQGRSRENSDGAEPSGRNSGDHTNARVGFGIHSSKGLFRLTTMPVGTEAAATTSIMRRSADFPDRPTKVGSAPATGYAEWAMEKMRAERGQPPVPAEAERDKTHPGEELRCVIAIVRHGDRTPKQKMKMRVRNASLLAIMRRYASKPNKQAKLKTPEQLQELLDALDTIIAEYQERRNAADGDEHGLEQLEDLDKLVLASQVLRRGGPFSGINRKAQLKPLAFDTVEPSASEERRGKDTPSAGDGGGNLSDNSTGQYEAMRCTRCAEALLVIKYGGVLTSFGKQQAEQFGRDFRHIYPNPDEGGLLRLHSTFRHDLKIYASDEGRVQVSAAAFTQGFLDLECRHSLAPIMYSMVQIDHPLLDGAGKNIAAEMARCKDAIRLALTEPDDAGESASASEAADLNRAARTRGTMRSRQPRSPTIRDSYASSPNEATTLAGWNSAGAVAGSGKSGSGGSGTDGANSLTAAGPLERSSLEMPTAWDPSARGELDDRRGESNAVVNFLRNQAERELRLALRRSDVNPTEELARLVNLVRDLTAQVAARAEQERASNALGHARVRARSHSNLCMDLSSKALVTSSPTTPGRLRAASSSKAQGYSSPGNDDTSDASAPAAIGEGGAATDEESPGTDDLPVLYGGETWQMMHERWSKIAKDLRNEKRNRYDTTKIPDVYDSIKYDIIHNRHVGLVGLKDLYRLARAFARVVVPNEYGISGGSKVQIGSQICTLLMGKILSDLKNAKSLTETAEVDWSGGLESTLQPKSASTPMAIPRRGSDNKGSSGSGGEGKKEKAHKAGSSDEEEEDTAAAPGNEVVKVEGHDEYEEHETQHMLNPAYTTNINSVHRQVRTRIYFTSEAHMHALASVLAYGDVSDESGGTKAGVIDPPSAWGPGCEFDYLTHIVIRMYEDSGVADLRDESRYRVEVLFSPGAVYDLTAKSAKKAAEKVKRRGGGLVAAFDEDSLPEEQSISDDEHIDDANSSDDEDENDEDDEAPEPDLEEEEEDEGTLKDGGREPPPVLRSRRPLSAADGCPLATLERLLERYGTPWNPGSKKPGGGSSSYSWR